MVLLLLRGMYCSVLLSFLSYFPFCPCSSLWKQEPKQVHFFPSSFSFCLCIIYPYSYLVTSSSLFTHRLPLRGGGAGERVYSPNYQMLHFWPVVNYKSTSCSRAHLFLSRARGPLLAHLLNSFSRSQARAGRQRQRRRKCLGYRTWRATPILTSKMTGQKSQTLPSQTVWSPPSARTNHS